MAPARVLRPRVLPRPGRVPALRADQPASLERHLDDHPVGLEANLPHPNPRQAQKPGKCRRDAHAVLPCKPLTVEQPAACREGGGRVANQCATSENFLRPGKPCSNPESWSHPDHTDAGRPRKRTRATPRDDAAFKPGGRRERLHFVPALRAWIVLAPGAIMRGDYA